MTSILVVLAVWLVPNIWCTVLCARSDLPQKHKTVLIIGIWLIPVLGVTFAYWEIPRGIQVSTDPLPRAGEKRFTPGVAPEAIEHAECGRFSMLDHLADRNGAPALDWAALEQWAGGRVEAIELGRRAWLLHFRDSLPPPANLLETRNAWILSSFEPTTAKAAARYVENTRERISKLLDGIAEFPDGARIILVVLENQEAYYDYVSHYDPEGGEFALSGGMFINEGCPHFVMVMGRLAILEPTIAHEMTHAALAHLELPLWLDEGIAVTTEQQVSVNYQDARDAVERIGQHLAFWNAERMQEFWTGASFRRTDEGNALSYDLARNIVQLLGREWKTFVEFATNASRDDGGAAAALGILKLDLGDIAAAALNVARQPGWSPNPAGWAPPAH